MSTSTRKINIIGTGYVGSSIAYALALKNVAGKIILTDVNPDKADGEAKDIRHGLPTMGTPDIMLGTYDDCKGSDLIIITAGRNRKQNESRLELAEDNTKILVEILGKIKPYCTDSVVLIVSNPVDVLVNKANEILQLPNGRVFGTGCLLDSSRFVRCIADYVGTGIGNVNGFVVGEHGETQTPIWSRVTVGGMPIEEYCESMDIPWDANVRKQIAEQVKAMGTLIIAEKERTHFGIATCVCYLAEAILTDQSIIAPVSSPLLGEHGVKDVSLSVPSVIAGNGVEKRIRQHWTPEEYRGFFDSVENVRKVLRKL